MSLSRRQFLGSAALAAVATTGLERAAAASAKPGATLDDIEHVVMLMQENRPFDQYFGTMSGVIGFEDPHAIPGVFRQTDLNLVDNPDGFVLPWHTDTRTTRAQTTGHMNHTWPVQHDMLNHGAMDRFVTAQASSRCMGYYTCDDLPYHWALADSFTICDRYHCSVLSETISNRIMFMSGTIDAEGTRGGPVIQDTQNQHLRWESYPEALQKAGIDWYVYQESDNFEDNPLVYFQAFQDKTTDLYRRGNSIIASTGPFGVATAAALKKQVLNGTLPQVSWIIGAKETTEHPDASPGRGAQFIDQVLEALTADMDVWAKTLFILNYDENDGSFDHVLPPTPPPGTPGEWLLNTPVDAGGYNGPVGLGYRVPMILISPFTKGPLVCSDLFDHTSVLQLLERRFGVPCPNISAWRRKTVGDLTSAINFAATPSPGFPSLPSGDLLFRQAESQRLLPLPVLPHPQVMPKQEKLPVRGRPSGLAATPATTTKPGRTTQPGTPTAPGSALPATGADTALPVVAVAVTAAALAAARLRKS